jgi:diadenosine tetraphosphate (Ap4A) HIT family hydrolase
MRLYARLLERPIIYRVFVWVLGHFPVLISRRLLMETPNLLAFPHPRPSHACHVLLLPRKSLRTFTELDPGDPFVADLITSVKHLVQERHLGTYRLVVNGGAYQEFPHLHFHLLSDEQEE